MSRLKKLFYRFCYALGFYPSRIRKKQAFLTYIKTRPLSFQKYELQKLSGFIALARDHNYYNAILEGFITNWTTKRIEEQKFVGEGYGRSSLNAYRYIRTKQKDYFEKVYFTNHPDLEKILWFQKQIYPLLKNQITVPAVEKIYRGDLLTVVYFDYLKLTKPQHIDEHKLVEFTRVLFQLSQEIKLQSIQETQLKNINNYENHHQYSRFIGAAKNYLEKENINPKQFEQTAITSKRLLTHGDLQKSNVYKDNILLDWDSFGLYPMGLDPAFVFFRLVFKNNLETDFQAWLTKHYKSFIPEKDWEVFERNFTYFLFVFSMELFLYNKNSRLEKALINKLKSYE